MAKKPKTAAVQPADAGVVEQTSPEVAPVAETTTATPVETAAVETVTETQGTEPVATEEQAPATEAEATAEAPAESNEQFLDSSAAQEAPAVEEVKPVEEVAALDVAEVKAVIQAEAEAVIQAQPLTADQVQLKLFKQQLEGYIKDFAPGVPHLDAARSANAQLRLVRLLKDAPTQLGVCFEEGYNFALNLILLSVKERGAFHDDYIFRFYDQPRIRNNPEERDNALFLMSFLKSVANPHSRAIVLKQVDIPRILKIYNSEEAVRKVQNFFNIR